MDHAIDLAAARLRTVPVADAPQTLIEKLGLQGAPQRPVISLRLAVAGVCAVALAAYIVVSYGRRSETAVGVIARNQPVSKKTPEPRIHREPIEKTQVATSDGAVPSPRRSIEKNPMSPTVDRKAPTTLVADNDYLNPGRDGAAPAYAGAGPIQKPSKLAMKDDFVQPSPLLLAFNDSGADLAKLAAQDKARIEQEVNTTDVRLYRAISLGMKHASMAELCAELSRQTGVQIEAGRNVADDNVTLFVTSRPARDVMRGISRVFGFIWEREGEDGHFRYTLKQDTTAQIGEEMIRNTDVSKALEKIAVQCRRESGQDSERFRAVKAIFRDLSASDLDVLRSGKTLVMSSLPGPSGNQTLDPSLAQTLLASMGGVVKHGDVLLGALPGSDENFIPFTNMAEARVIVSMRLRISEFGGAVVDVQTSAGGKVDDKWGGLSQQEILDTVPGLAEAPIHNAEANAALKSAQGMSAVVALKPEPTTPLSEQGEVSAIPGEPAIRDMGPSPHGKELNLPNLPSNVVLTADLLMGNYQFTGAAQPPKPWMTSDDLWEAVHVATKSDIIADSYSRLFPKKDYSGDLFTVLSKACDQIQYKWGASDGFLTGRSTAFHWQRLNEVPKRLLQRWQTLRQKNGFLSLESVLDMARLSDRQLDAAELGKAIYFQWKLREWGVLSRPFFARQYNAERLVARFMAALSPAQLAQLQQGTLLVGDVSRDQLDLLNYGSWRPLDSIAPDARLTASYVPPLKYYWHPFFEDGVEPVRTDFIFGDTPEAVQAEVDRRYPKRGKSNEIGYSTGLIGLGIGGKSPLVLGDQRYSVGQVIKD